MSTLNAVRLFPAALSATLTFAFVAPVFAQAEPAPSPASSTGQSADPPAQPVAPASAAPVVAPAPAAAPVAAPAAAPVASPAPKVPSPRGSWYRIRAVAELGYLAVLSHKLQFGKDGTYFDYVKQGGQDNHYTFTRASLEAELFRRHTLVFLFQPLDLQTSVELQSDIRMAGRNFPQGTPVDLRYGFPFFRASYLYDLVPNPKHELSIGLSVQIRNATIDFASKDGTIFTSNRDIGLVPILKSRGRYSFERGAFVGYEVDGFYAPISVLNGSDNEVTGAIVDLSLRGGLAIPTNGDVFLNLRYIGGGGVGQSDPEPTYDGYTKNWLHVMSVSIGASLATL